MGNLIQDKQTQISLMTAAINFLTVSRIPAQTLRLCTHTPTKNWPFNLHLDSSYCLLPFRSERKNKRQFLKNGTFVWSRRPFNSLFTALWCRAYRWKLHSSVVFASILKLKAVIGFYFVNHLWNIAFPTYLKGRMSQCIIESNIFALGRITALATCSRYNQHDENHGIYRIAPKSCSTLIWAPSSVTQPMFKPIHLRHFTTAPACQETEDVEGRGYFCQRKDQGRNAVQTLWDSERRNRCTSSTVPSISYGQDRRILSAHSIQQREEIFPWEDWTRELWR